MAQVPSNSLPNVLPSGIAEGYQRGQATPDAFGAQIGEAGQQLAGQLGQASDSAQQTALTIQNTNNQIATNSNVVAFQKSLDALTYGDPNDPNSKGYLSLSGQAAVAGYQTAADTAEKTRMAMLGNMTPIQGRMFDDASRRLLNNTMSDLGQHYVKAQAQWANDTDNSALEADANSAILNKDNPDRFNAALMDSAATTISMGQRLGWSPEVINQQVQNVQSNLNMAVLKAKANDDPMGAWNFYQQNQQHFTGEAQAQAESMLKPQVFASQSSQDADRVISGGVGQVAQSITQEAQQQNVDPVLALTTAKIESSTGANANAPGGGKAFGIFQTTPSTWQTRGGGNPNDVGQQVHVGVANLAASTGIANQAVGGAAQPWQIYMVAQQGPGGGPALLQADPNMSAVEALTPAYKGNSAAALQAIKGNGGTANMSVGSFLGMWQQRYATASAGISVPDPNAPVPAGTPTSSNPADHLNDWLSQANNVTDPLGGHDPRYVSMVQEQIKAKTGALVQQQEQQDRANKSTLLTGTWGLSPAGAGAPGIGQQSPPPTTLSQLLTNPTMKAAWIAASPDTQHAVLQQLSENSKAGPAITPASQTTYYQLLSESTRDPATFLKENLADPDFLGSMPHSQVQELMNRQASIDGKAVAQQQRQVTMSHARDVVMPDVVAAGIGPRQAASNPTIAQSYSEFDGRLQEAVENFQKQNEGKLPNDAQIKAMGQTLLTPGFLRGSGSLWGALPNDSSTRLYQTETNGTTSRFYPAIPAAEQARINTEYASRFNGALPTPAMSQRIYMLAHQPQPSPGLPQSRTIIQPRQAAPQPAQAASPADQSQTPGLGVGTGNPRLSRFDQSASAPVFANEQPQGGTQ
jgi:hypothetical protein